MNNNLNNYRSLKLLLQKQANYLTPEVPHAQNTVPAGYGVTNTNSYANYAPAPVINKLEPERFANPLQKRVMEGAPSSTPNLPPMPNRGMGLPTLPQWNQVGRRDFANTKAAPRSRGFNPPTLTQTPVPGYGATNY